MAENECPNDFSIYELSVRTLAEYVFRSGSLSSISFHGISGAEGTRLHTRVFSDLKNQYSPSMIETEYMLKSEFPDNGVVLRVRGRADCLLWNQENQVTVLEIKSCTGENMNLKELVRPVHQAQVMLYAHMFLEKETEYKGVYTSLRYVSLETMHYVEECKWVDRIEASDFFTNTCKTYIDFAKDLLLYQTQRDESIRAMPFPYDLTRSGQKDLMSQVVQTIAQKSILLAAAPTGTGKTVSTLFPALKSLAHHRCERIFYLTAKAAARTVAQKALSDMRDKGLLLRSITLQSKESMCLFPHMYCEAKQCPYAIQYYDRLQKGIDELLLDFAITPERILITAEKHTLCPHELALDISLFCDVIIGDYNHAFHPRVKLERYFIQQDSSHVILIDEAHNMVDRSRSMFSAGLNWSVLKECQKNILGMDRRVDGYMADLQSYFQILSDSILRDEDGFSHVEKEIDAKAVLQSGHFRGSRSVPKTLYAVLWKFCHFVRPILDLIPAGEIRKSILQFYFDARFFLTILELHFDDAYVFTAELPDSDSELVLTLDCLDASTKIKNLLIDKHAAVFFSATLSPMEYYQTMILGRDYDAKADTLELPCPFPPENLSVYVLDDIKTTYQERHFSLDVICDSILTALKGNKGNYMVFLPSFQYLNSLYQRFQEKMQQDEIPGMELLRQTSSMSGEMKEQFLRRFDEYGQKTLVAFAVLGGHFGEGIDLVGDRLNGVFIIGVGLPQLCPQREIMNQFYQNLFGDGFSFAYRYPGWEKVLQAAGRVIRDDSDTGFVVLIDERYDRMDYRVLFPDHWRPLFLHHDVFTLE